MKRNAIRMGPNPHSTESIDFTVRRYGVIKPETLNEIVLWLKNHKNEYEFEIKQERLKNIEIGKTIIYPTIKTIKKGSCVFKILDNERDAQNTLANIRNKDFPKNKQGQ